MIQSVVESLRRNGAVVVTDVAEHELIDTVVSELRLKLDEVGLNTLGDFNGSCT
jgi:hypothetical protein